MYIKKNHLFALLVCLSSLINLIGMDLPKELQKKLKKNKNKIIAIMALPTDKIVDLKNLGTFNNLMQKFFYVDNEKIKKSVNYPDIEKIIGSEDEDEFNIGDMHNDEIQIPNHPSETDALYPKQNKPCFCSHM